MGALFTKRKMLTVATALSLITLIVGSTFTWTSLNSQKVNEWRGSSTITGPGGSLHDDHDNTDGKDKKKHVYIENWGDAILYCRIKLSEYMEMGNPGQNTGSIDVAKNLRNTNNTSTPLLDGTVLADRSIVWTPHVPDTSIADCGKDFHKYFTWSMGGQKWFMPATDSDKQNASQENGSVLSDPKGEYNANTPGAKQTLPSKIISMADYNALSDQGQLDYYWVIDTDGWCYWSQQLRPGKTTGLLLNEVTRTNEPIKKDYYYAVNVEAEMADYTFGFPRALQSATPTTPDDFTNWITGAAGVEKATPEAAQLLKDMFLRAVEEGDYGTNVDVNQAEQTIDQIINNNQTNEP